MKTPYSYGLVRYVHDVVTEEFVNIGVVLYAPAVGFLRGRCTHRYGRASRFFGGVDGPHFLSTVALVERVLDSESRAMRGFAFDKPATDAFEVIRTLFVIDDSALQFTPGGGGLTRDPEATLDELYERFIGRYEPEPRQRRKEEDIWRSVKSQLEARGVAEQLRPYRVDAKLISHQFEHSIKNGKWHAIEPLSFDLAEADSLRSKAVKWLGLTQALSESAENVRILYVTAPPADRKLEPAYQNALGLLGASAIDHEIVDESAAGDLAERLRLAVDQGE